MPDEIEDHEDRRPATIPWSIIIGLGGILLGVTGSVIVVGGSLKQIDINTQQIAELRANGPPSMLGIRLQVDGQVSEIAKLTEKVEKIPYVDAAQSALLSTLRAQADELLTGRDRQQEGRVEALQRIARLESQMIALADRVEALSRNMNDDRARAQQLQQQQLLQLRGYELDRQVTTPSGGKSK